MQPTVIAAAVYEKYSDNPDGKRVQALTAERQVRVRAVHHGVVHARAARCRVAQHLVRRSAASCEHVQRQRLGTVVHERDGGVNAGHGDDGQQRPKDLLLSTTQPSTAKGSTRSKRACCCQQLCSHLHDLGVRRHVADDGRGNEQSLLVELAANDNLAATGF